MRSKKLEKTEWSGLCAQVSQELTRRHAQIEIASLPQTEQRQGSLPVVDLTYDSERDLLEVSIKGSQHMVFRPSELYVGYGPNGLETVGIVDEYRTWQIELRRPGADVAAKRRPQRRARQAPEHKAVAKVVAAIRRELPHSCDGITVVSSGAQVVLRGELEWEYQRKRAAKAAAAVPDVGQVDNQIQVRSWTEPVQIAQRVREAFPG